MADPQTTNILLSIPSHGSDVDAWDVPVNGDFSALDGWLGGQQTISLTNAPVTLTSPSGTPTPSGGPTQAQNACLKLTGTLSGDILITLPLPGRYIVNNQTVMGSFVIQVKGASPGNIISLPPGTAVTIFNDGANVIFVDLPIVGSFLDYAGTAVPRWVGASSIPPYLICDGSTFNASTYPTLNTILGGNTLPDFRGSTAYYYNSGTSRLTTAGSGLNGDVLYSLKTSQSGTLVTANLPPYTPAGTNGTVTVATNLNNVAYSGASSSTGGGGFGFTFPQNFGTITSTGSGPTFTGSAQGGTSTPFGLVATGTISGIRLIRAG